MLLLSVVLAAQTTSSDQAAGHEQKPAAIQGIVTNSLTGAPLSHAHVTLADSVQRASGRYGAITKPDGRFSIVAIPPGKYGLTVARQGYLPTSGNQESNNEIALKADEQVQDLVLKLIPVAVISGRVLDLSGSPLPEISVEAIGPSYGRVETNDRGEFRIGDLPAGKYFIKASPQTGPLPPEIRTDGTLEINYGTTFYPSSVTPKSATAIVAQAGVETDRVDIKLKPMPIVRVSGAVLGVPHGARNVWLDFDRGSAYQRSTRADAEMKFTIWRLPRGHYLLTAHSIDPIGKHMQSAPAEIDLSTSNVDNVNLVMAQPFELDGQVHYESMADASDQKEKPTLSFNGIDSPGGSDFEAEVQPDGAFKVTEVDPGRYFMSVEGLPGNFYVKSIEVGGAESQDAILYLRSGPPKISLDLKLGINGAEVSGAVLNQKGPVSNATVALLAGDGDGCGVLKTVDADSKGNYAFHGLAPGKYRLFAVDSKQMNGSRCDLRPLFEGVMEKIDLAEGDHISQNLRVPDVLAESKP